jgi:hypothetical protein
MFLKSKSQTMQQTRCGEKGSIPEPRSPENKAVIKRKRVRGRSQANEKQSNATIDATLDCAIQLANMNQNEEKGASATDAAELHWSEVKKDRNRLNPGLFVEKDIIVHGLIDHFHFALPHGKIIKIFGANVDVLVEAG